MKIRFGCEINENIRKTTEARKNNDNILLQKLRQERFDAMTKVKTPLFSNGEFVVDLSEEELVHLLKWTEKRGVEVIK